LVCRELNFYKRNILRGETMRRKDFLIMLLSAPVLACWPIEADAGGAGGKRGRGGRGAGYGVPSGVNTLVYTIKSHNSADGGTTIRSVKIVDQAANGTASARIGTISSGTGKPIRVGQLFYKSKSGYSGTDSFTYQIVRADGTSGEKISFTVTVR
jgi:hypothetical protein